MLAFERREGTRLFLEGKRVRRFIGGPIKPGGTEFLTQPSGGEPPVPRAFVWDDRTLRISAVLRTWRSTKTDRGDAYLKRHWFELETEDGATIEVYYDREARRGAPQWWLYTIEDA
jgi:hypothetical protein